MNKQQVKKHKDELAILFPNEKLVIGGEEIEVAEYSLLQQLQYRHLLMPFVVSLRKMLADDESEFRLDELMACISEHYKDVIALVALSINKSVDYVEGLKGEDVDCLLMAWWAVNSDFFTRKAVEPMLESIMKNNQETLIGETFSNS